MGKGGEAGAEGEDDNMNRSVLANSGFLVFCNVM
jgi:hypothetical protein